MISANRTRRHFNVDKSLLATEKERDQLRRAISGGMLVPARRSRFRRRAVRLDDRIERWMESGAWVRFDIWLGSVCGFALAGFILYFLYIVAEAWFSGAIGRAVN